MSPHSGSCGLPSFRDISAFLVESSCFRTARSYSVAFMARSGSCRSAHPDGCPIQTAGATLFAGPKQLSAGARGASRANQAWRIRPATTKRPRLVATPHPPRAPTRQNTVTAEPDAARKVQPAPESIQKNGQASVMQTPTRNSRGPLSRRNACSRHVIFILSSVFCLRHGCCSAGSRTEAQAFRAAPRAPRQGNPIAIAGMQRRAAQ